MRTLRLTSPHMHGLDVRRAQHLLDLHGEHVASDGDFGPLSAAACRDEKWWQGYAAKDCTPIYGEELDGLLTGRIKPSKVMKWRAGARVKAANSHTGRVESVWHLAVSQNGETEHPPGSNDTKYGQWYGVVCPWCAVFVSWVCEHVKNPISFRYTYVPYIVHDAEAGRNALGLSNHPALDNSTLILACYDWQHDGVADHVGITIPESWLAVHASKLLLASKNVYGGLGARDFWSMEGNTGGPQESQDNGGTVLLQKRSRDLVQAFVHVNF